MAYTYNEIIEIAKLSGIPNDPGSTLRPGDRGKSGGLSWHHYGKAVDFMGYNQDALATLFMSIPSLEVLHYSDATGKWYGWNGSKNRPIDPVANADLVQQHRNHLHVAMSEEQVGPGSILEQLRKGIKTGLENIIKGGQTILGGIIPKPSNVTEAIGNVGTAMTSVAQSAISIGKVADLVTRAFLPTNMMRGILFLFGFIFILIGIFFLGREVKESKA